MWTSLLEGKSSCTGCKGGSAQRPVQVRPRGFLLAPQPLPCGLGSSLQLSLKDLVQTANTSSLWGDREEAGTPPPTNKRPVFQEILLSCWCFPSTKKKEREIEVCLWS
jgi:hypothetical protein